MDMGKRVNDLIIINLLVSYKNKQIDDSHYSLIGINHLHCNTFYINKYNIL